MNFYLLLAPFVAISLQSFSNDSMDSYRIQTTLKYKAPLSEELLSTKEVLVLKRNPNWMPLTDAKENVVLLGRVVQEIGTALKVEYMLIDGNRKSESIVATPSIVSRLQEPASIAVTEIGKPKYTISMVAEEADSKTTTPQLSPDRN